MVRKAADRGNAYRASPRRGWIYVGVTGIALSLFAVAIVLGNVAAGAPPEPDENSWAHLFQLAMAAQLPLLLTFMAVADWKHQRRLAIVILGIQLVAAGAAFAALMWSGY